VVEQDVRRSGRTHTKKRADDPDADIVA
jgi:hypothetical protein